jgi:predicted nucleic acid-binding protein
MNIHVMDANTLLASLRGEPGAEVTNGLLADPAIDCIAHSVNLCEVYYDSLRSSDQTAAEKALAALTALGLSERSDMDQAFWKSIGQLKVSPGKVSLADCFALALAIRTGGTLVTSDHHEFDRVVPLGLCPILFIR